MPSMIDDSVPADGAPARKADLRSNLEVAKTEMEHAGFFRSVASGAVERTGAEKLGELISVKDFGAIGDGASHPVSEWLAGGSGDRGFADLAAIQAEYPHVGSLEDEIDWAGTQAAIDHVRDRGGGAVFSPSGVYVCNRAIVLPSQPSFTNSVRRAVSWYGENWFTTWYEWRADLGPDTYAVQCGDRDGTSADTHQNAILEHLSFDGPGKGWRRVPGQAPCAMHGIGWGPRRHMRFVRARYFNRGLDIRGDQSLFEYCDFPNNYYGAYWNSPRMDAYGDMTFIRCYFTGQRFAGIGVAPDTWIGSCQFLGGYIGGAPYGFYKEPPAEASDPYNAGILAGCTFDGLQFEWIGNALIADGRPEAERTSEVVNTSFRNCYFSWDASRRLAGRPRTAVFDLHRMDHFRMTETRKLAWWAPGDVCWANLKHSKMIEIDGAELDALFNICEDAGVPLLPSGFASSSPIRLSASSWRGTMVQLASIGGSLPVIRGDLVAHDRSRYGPARTAREVLVGVAMTAASAGQWVPVAQHGIVSVNLPGGAGVLSGHGVPLEADFANPGKAKEAAGLTAAVFGAEVSGSGLDAVTARLRGLA